MAYWDSKKGLEVIKLYTFEFISGRHRQDTRLHLIQSAFNFIALKRFTAAILSKFSYFIRTKYTRHGA